jgi:hypothetical protein
MRDVDVLIKVFVEIETILAEHTQHHRNPDDAIVRILLAMDRPKVAGAVDRLAQGYGRLRRVK